MAAVVFCSAYCAAAIVSVHSDDILKRQLARLQGKGREWTE
jgi:hypothetical protein